MREKSKRLVYEITERMEFMSVNIDKIKGRTRELRMTDEQVAQKIHMHPSTYSRKLNAEKGESFTLKHIFLLVDVLRFSKLEAADVFLGDKFAS